MAWSAMSLFTKIVDIIFPPPPPPPEDQVEVVDRQMRAVDRTIDRYRFEQGIDLYPECHPDGTVHLVDSNGDLYAIVHPDGRVEDKQVCEEPAWPSDGGMCDPNTQSCPPLIYQDDGTQTQNASTPFSESSPVTAPATSPAKEAPKVEPAVVTNDPALPKASDPAVDSGDGSGAMEVGAGTAASAPGATAAGTMAIATPAPPEMDAPPAVDVGLPAAAQSVSAQFCVGPGVSTTETAEKGSTIRAAGGVAVETQGGSADVPGAVALSADLSAAAVREALLAQMNPAASGSKLPMSGENGLAPNDGSGNIDWCGVSIVGERRFDVGGHLHSELVSARAAISHDVCTTAHPVFDGQRVPQSYAAALGASAFCLDADAAAIAEAQKGMGGQPHYPTISSQIAFGPTKKGMGQEYVPSAHHRGDSHERQGNGGERDGSGSQQGESESFLFDDDSVMSFS